MNTFTLLLQTHLDDPLISLYSNCFACTYLRLLFHRSQNDSPHGDITDLIPYISAELRALKNGLNVQLRGLETFLAQRNLFIFQQTTREYDSLFHNFLRILQQFVDGTLIDLFRFINNVEDLMRDYEQDLEAFVHHSPSTIRNIQSCIKDLKALAD